MPNCAMCGKRISLITDNYYYLSGELKNYKICEDCDNRQKSLQHYAEIGNEENFELVKSDLSSMTENINDDVVKDYLHNYIMENDLLLKNNIDGLNGNIKNNMLHGYNEQETDENRKELNIGTRNESEIADKLENLHNCKQIQIQKNPYFEYDVTVINDLKTGEVDSKTLISDIQVHSINGWRLAFTFTNEIGKTNSMIGFGGIAGGINATIESTILIYERCIKPAE